MLLAIKSKVVYQCPRFKQTGTGMIEVLLAIFIFSTGILGVASMQLAGIGMLSNSNSLAIAVIGASDMADRMRANPQGLEAGAYNAVTGEEENPTCNSECSPSQTAQLDAYEIMAQLNQDLPSASFSVTSVSNGLYTVSINWTEKVKSSVENKTHRFTFLPYNP